MNIVQGNRLWININNIPAQYPYMVSDEKCDVAIIGAGITGAICAYYFCMAGIDVILADKSIIGYGSTSASTSILQYEVDTDLAKLVDLYGKSKAFRSFLLNQKAVDDIEKIVNDNNLQCGFSRKECLYYSSSEDDIPDMVKEYELRKECGLKVEYLDSVEASKRFSFPVKTGIYSLWGAGEIDPYMFAHEIIKLLHSKGAKVYENTQISSFETDNKSITLNTFHGRKIKAKKAVLATGYNILEVIKKPIASISRTFTVATKPVDNFNGWYNKCIIRDNETYYTYFRTTPDNRILIGGEDSKIIRKHGKMANLYNSSRLVQKKYDALTSKAQSYFPGIKNITPEYCFNGIFAVTKDGLPYIGELPELKNLYLPLCFGSNGILYAAIAAQLLRDMFLGNASKEDMELYKFDR